MIFRLSNFNKNTFLSIGFSHIFVIIMPNFDIFLTFCVVNEAFN